MDGYDRSRRGYRWWRIQSREKRERVRSDSKWGGEKGVRHGIFKWKLRPIRRNRRHGYRRLRPPLVPRMHTKPYRHIHITQICMVGHARTFAFHTSQRETPTVLNYDLSNSAPLASSSLVLRLPVTYPTTYYYYCSRTRHPL